MMTQTGILAYASALPPGNLTYYENSTILPTEADGHIFYWETVLVPVIWGILILIGGIGNGLVIYVIVFHGERRVTHCYIVNLAITDLAFLFFCVPFTMTFYALPQWIFGNIMCKFVMYIIYVTMMATCLTLTAMTIDRYFAIVHPLKSMNKRTPRVAILTSCSIWIVSFILCIPFFIHNRVVEAYHNGPSYFCRDMWPSMFASRLQQALVVSVCYVIPLIIIVICYTLMLRHLWKNDSTRHRNRFDRPVSDPARDLQDKNRRKVAKMIAIVVILFALSWLPIHVLLTWKNFDPFFPLSNELYNVKIFAHTLSYTNSCVNPFVYSFMGDGFRRAFRRSFPRCLKTNRVSPSGSHVLSQGPFNRVSDRSLGSEKSGTISFPTSGNSSLTSSDEKLQVDDNFNYKLEWTVANVFVGKHL
ncbi:G-protein coupled receptor 54-like [Lineus longissimus]|uniref:G-protein coupled receptor 54-like n=1 Tax=Lineus longissimus TaxID=88925 RepID=UPI002B4F576E